MHAFPTSSKLERPFKKIIPQPHRQYKRFWNGFSEFFFVFYKYPFPDGKKIVPERILKLLAAM